MEDAISVSSFDIIHSGVVIGASAFFLGHQSVFLIGDMLEGDLQPIIQLGQRMLPRHSIFDERSVFCDGDISDTLHEWI